MCLLYCCVASACKVDGIKFTMSLMDFADALEPEEMESWTTAQQGDAETDGDEAKKSKHDHGDAWSRRGRDGHERG